MNFFLSTIQTNRKRKGFTLIEILVSLSIFLILLGALMTSFFQLYRAQRDANDVRKVVADLRTLSNFVQDEMRTKTIDFYSYSPTYRFSFDTPQHVLYLTDKNGTHQTTITFIPSPKDVVGSENGGSVVFTKQVRIDKDHSWSADSGFAGDPKQISIPHVQLKDVSFSLAPMGDPNARVGNVNNLSDSTLQMQPSVTMHVRFGNNYYLQTTFSSRVY